MLQCLYDPLIDIILDKESTRINAKGYLMYKDVKVTPNNNTYTALNHVLF